MLSVQLSASKRRQRSFPDVQAAWSKEDGGATSAFDQHKVICHALSSSSTVSRPGDHVYFRASFQQDEASNRSLLSCLRLKNSYRTQPLQFYQLIRQGTRFPFSSMCHCCTRCYRCPNGSLFYVPFQGRDEEDDSQGTCDPVYEFPSNTTFVTALLWAVTRADPLRERLTGADRMSILSNGSQCFSPCFIPNDYGSILRLYQDHPEQDDANYGRFVGTTICPLFVCCK